MGKKGYNPKPPEGVVKPSPPPSPPKPVDIWGNERSRTVKPRTAPYRTGFVYTSSWGKTSPFDGSECPYCHSRNINAMEQVQMDGHEGSQKVECYDCGRYWTELVRIIGWMEE